MGNGHKGNGWVLGRVQTRPYAQLKDVLWGHGPDPCLFGRDTGVNARLTVRRNDFRFV